MSKMAILAGLCQYLSGLSEEALHEFGIWTDEEGYCVNISRQSYCFRSFEKGAVCWVFNEYGMPIYPQDSQTSVLLNHILPKIPLAKQVEITLLGGAL